MPDTSRPDLLTDSETLSVLRAHLDLARRNHAALESAEIDDVLRLVPGRRAVLAGRWHNRAVVIRLAEPQEQERLAREWQELTRIWPIMQDGPYRVPEPLFYLPDAGLMVVERVDGPPLLEHLWHTLPARRVAHLRPAAEWLRHYTETTEYWSAGNVAGWLARAERGAAHQAFARLRIPEVEILRHLRAIAGALAGCDWRVAICHGDFHPNNLILSKNRLTGIDTGGSARLPVCKDIARFLVHMGRRGMIPSTQRQLAWTARDSRFLPRSSS